MPSHSRGRSGWVKAGQGSAPRSVTVGSLGGRCLVAGPEVPGGIDPVAVLRGRAEHAVGQFGRRVCVLAGAQEVVAKYPQAAGPVSGIPSVEVAVELQLRAGGRAPESMADEVDVAIVDGRGAVECR